MIYSYDLESDRDYPVKDDFTINYCKKKGTGIYEKRPFKKGEIVARMTSISTHAGR